MAERKKLPNLMKPRDVMSDVLEARPAQVQAPQQVPPPLGVQRAPAILEAVAQEGKAPATKPAQKVPAPKQAKEGKPAAKAGRKTAELEKTTFYLSPEGLEQIEEAWLKVRLKAKRKVSKSEVIELAVSLALADLDKADSQLAKRL